VFCEGAGVGFEDGGDDNGGQRWWPVEVEDKGRKYTSQTFSFLKSEQ